MEQFAEHRVDIILVADMLDSEVIKYRLQMFILAPQRLVRPPCNLNIAVVTHHRQDLLRQDFVTQWGIIRPVVAIRGLRGVDIPLAWVVARFHHFIH